MSRALCFRRGGPDAALELAFGIEKIDRRKLYGFIDTEVIDGTGRICTQVMLAGDGRTRVGRGSSALLMLDPDGNYLERQRLTPVGPSGEPLVRVPSSFDAPILLDAQASIDELLSHNIKAAYLLTPPVGASDLLEELRRGVIYTFPFSFRGGLEKDVGFLLANAEGLPFLLLGKPTRLEFVALHELTDSDTEEAAEIEDDDDEVDFAMI